MTHIYTLDSATNSGSRLEIHLLNPGETFQRFGGSSHGLTVRGRKASTVTRWVDGGSGYTRDIEWNLSEPRVWKWVADLISQGWTLRVINEVKEEEESVG
jgi:hypothetical protein